MPAVDIIMQSKDEVISEHFNYPRCCYIDFKVSFLEQRNLTSRIEWEIAEFTYINRFHMESASA